MRGLCSVLAFSACCVLTTVAFGFPSSDSGPRYPRVYGATGRPYGLTVANYQYERQYGRPWHGYGGISGASVPYYSGGCFGNYSSFYAGPVFSVGYPAFGVSGAYVYQGFVPSYGVPYYGGWGYGGYGSVGLLSPSPAATIVVPPPLVVGNPFNNAVINETLQENADRWGGPLQLGPQAGDVKLVDRPLKPSSPEGKLKSASFQTRGDLSLLKQNFVRAVGHYKDAIKSAEDQAEPHFRLAFAYLGLGEFGSAIAEIKRGLRLDPGWPKTGDSLDTIFGEDNALVKLSVIHMVADYVREDIRDPDRLFLLGTLLYFDDDERALEIFETAMRLAGRADHVELFLVAGEPAEQQFAPPQNPQPQHPAVVPPGLPPLPGN